VASSWLREIRFPSPRLSVAERPRQKPVSIPRTLSGPFAAMGYAPTKSTGQELELSKVLSSTLRIVVHALHVPNDGTLQCTLLFTTPAGGHAVRLPCDETGGYRHSIAHGIDELALNWAAAAARVEAILVPFLVEVYATGFGSRGGGAAS
jgi:hypothetical protein